jgi:chaperonin GroES
MCFASFQSSYSFDFVFPSAHVSLTFFCLQQALRNIKNLVPLLDRVLVQRLKPEAKTASGIFLPESTLKDINQATVLAVGPGAIDRTGNKIPMSVTSGDKVLIPQVRAIVGRLWAGISARRLTKDNSLVAVLSRSARTSTLFSGTRSE